MYIVHVHVRVHPQHVRDFKTASVENAKNSLREAGVARFDVVQQKDDACSFVLVEAYRTEADAAKHKETPHYAAWREAVEGMMAEPRFSVKFTNCHPGENGWG